jgi:Lon protease-like protein
MPEIPLFPLPLVMFPDVVVPLHIFEDRYKFMVNRCIDESSAFGIVLFPPGTSSESESTIQRIGVTARIVQFERVEDGRLNIMAAGVTRFRILQFTADKPCWTANVEFFDDEPESDEELQESLADVVRLYRDVHRLASQLRGVDAGEIQIPDSPVSLSYLVSYILDIAPAAKQELLEMTSTTGRLKSLAVHMDGTIQRVNAQIARDAMNRKVKGNGHYGAWN